uniref:Peptidase S74 domain-containing protein n=1 Tax=viral metagenome TaxID=1070528 RepID=A0A6C0KSP6_9ZZZZ
MLVFDTSPDDPSFIVVGSNISKVAEFGSTLDNTYISLYANDPLSNVGYIIGTSNQNLANPVFSIGMINTNTNAIYPDFTISNHFIGINNTTPQYTLDTSGNINLSGNIYNNALQTGYWYNPNNYLYVPNSNVGIGTSSSQYKFHVVGSTYITGSIYASNLKPSAFIDTTIATNISSGTLPLTVLPTTNVTSPASTYGSGAQVAQITTDIYGRVVQAQNVPIYITQSQILGLTSNGLTPAAIYGNYSNLVNIPFYYDANNTTYYLGSGNIGIGTTNANLGKLQVQGDGYFNGTLFASNLNIIGELTTINVATSNSTQLDIINSGPGPALKVVQKDGSTVSQFYNNTGPVFTIAGSGSIGIGSSIPTVPLDIVGNVKISGGTISGGGLVQSAFTDTTNATNITSGTLSASRLPNTTVTSGNYGTANSNVILNIDSTGRILSAVNCNIQIAPGQVTGLSTVATSGNYNDLINKTFILNGTAAYYSGGNIGISTNTPDSLLTIGGGVTDTTSTLKINVSDSSVAGAITDRIYLTSLGASNTRISHSATSNLYIYVGQSNNTGNFHLMSGAVGLNQYQDRITINNNGYVGINNSTPNYTLDLVGNFNLSGSFYNGGNSIATAGKIVASALPTTTVVAGSYGLASSNTSIIVDSTGRIVSASNIGIILPVGQVTGLAPSATIDTTNAGNITTGTLSSARFPTTTVIAGGYGAAASNISIAVDATGRIVSASNIGIILPVSQVTGLAPSATIDTTNAANISSGTLSASRLPGTTVTAGNYGLAASNITISVDTTGRITSATNIAIILPVGQVTGLAPSATIDTTNAANITSGTLLSARLPSTTVTAGGYSAAASNVAIYVDSTGRILSASNIGIVLPVGQVTGLAPSATIDTTNAGNISSGTLLSARFPTTTVTAGGYGAAASNISIAVDATGRIVSASNIGIVLPVGQVTGLAASATIDTTNAANISSGTLLSARLPTTTVVAGGYSAASSNVAIYIDSTGRILSASNVGIVLPVGQVTGLAPSATIDTTNAANIASGTLSAGRLPTTTVVAGGYGAAASNITINVDSTGRITSATNIGIILPVGQVTGLAPSATIDTTNAANIASGTLSAGRLPTTTVVAGGYGAAASNITINVDSTGRITSATNIGIILPVGQVTGLAPSATIDTTNAANIGSGTLPLGRLPTTNISTYGGPYGSATQSSIVTTDAYGRVTAVSSTNISITSNAVSGLSKVAGTGVYNDLINAAFTYSPTGTTYYNGTGNVGIGTQTALSALHVMGDILASGKLVASNLIILGELTTVNTTTSNSTQLDVINNGTGPALKVAQNTPDTVAEFYNNGSIAMQISASGNIGIGTKNATSTLYVQGTTTITGNISAGNLVTSAFTDTTNAANIGSGTLSSARLPSTTVTAGGYGAAASNVAIYVDSTGRILSASNVGIILPVGQVTGLAPSATIDTTNAANIASGTLSAVRLPTTTVVAGGYGAAASNISINVDSTGRILSASNVGIVLPVGQVTGLAPSATIDTTNAANISSGTLSSARFPTTTVTAGGYGATSSNVAIYVDASGRILSASNVAIVLPVGQVTGLAPSATIDTTNASNITSGTLSSNLFPTTGVSAGVYGDASHIPQINIDATGRIISSSTNQVSITTGQVSGLSYTALSANNLVSPPSAGTYGTAASGYVPIITIDVYGRVTSASSALLTVPTSQLYGYITLSQISGLAASASTDTTNAANITSGTLSTGRLPTTTVTAGGYGGTSSNVAIYVDATGRILSASNIGIVLPVGQVTGLAPSATIDTTNAANIKTGTLSCNLLPTTNINTYGQFGSANQVPIITTDSFGRVVNLQNQTINLTVANLPSSSVNAGTYGSSTSIPTFTVDGYGRITLASNNAIVLSGVAASGQYSNLMNIPFVYNNTGTGAAASNIYTPSYVYNVGIGMSNATAYPLDVNGIVRATQFIGDGSLLTGIVTSGGGGSGGGNSQWISSNQYIYVTSNVGIGTTIVSANNALQVQGNASITSLTTSNIITSNITILSSTAFLSGDTQVYRSALQTNPIRQFFTVGVSGQSNFTLSSPTVGRYTAYGSNVEIYQNGIKLGYQDINNNDYSVSTITNSVSTGFSVTLVNGANLGDYIDITIWPQLVSTNLILQPGYVYQQFYDLWSASNNNVYYNIGYVGIGTALPSYPLHVAGNIYTTNSIISFSDIINKTNIETIPNALDTVKKLRGVTYNRIDSGEQQIGLIAQEVLEIVPEVVSKTKDGLAVAYGNIVGLLIESIKELSEEVKVLRNIIHSNSNIVVQ